MKEVFHPGVDVDVSKVTGVYDAHWAKLEAEAKAQERAGGKVPRSDGQATKSGHTGRKRCLTTKLCLTLSSTANWPKTPKCVHQYQNVGKQIERVQALLRKFSLKTIWSILTMTSSAVWNSRIRRRRRAVGADCFGSEAGTSERRQTSINESYNVIFNIITAQRKFPPLISTSWAGWKTFGSDQYRFYPQKTQASLSGKNKLKPAFWRLTKLTRK